MKIVLILLLLLLAPRIAMAEEIIRIWLTHKANDPSKIVVNWMAKESGNSVVQFGLTAEFSDTVRIHEKTTLHHVEIPLKHQDTTYHYLVSTEDHHSAIAPPVQQIISLLKQ